MITVVDGIFIVLLCGYAFYLGHEIARVKDNNYSELFQGYIKNNAELERDKYYWMDCYNQLYSSIPDDFIEDKVMDMRGRVVGVYLKKSVNESKDLMDIEQDFQDYMDSVGSWFIEHNYLFNEEEVCSIENELGIELEYYVEEDLE